MKRCWYCLSSNKVLYCTLAEFWLHVRSVRYWKREEWFIWLGVFTRNGAKWGTWIACLALLSISHWSFNCRSAEGEQPPKCLDAARTRYKKSYLFLLMCYLTCHALLCAKTETDEQTNSWKNVIFFEKILVFQPRLNTSTFLPILG